jgi:hypothetical protein
MLATGHPRGSIPEGLDQRIVAFRAWLADTRVLLVIEDAAGAAQVRSLLPGTPGCAVILTSRADLRALTVLDGARHYPIGVLQPAEALELLDRVLGGRAAAEPAAAAELAALCGYLPLALRIAAASLSAAPELQLRGYVARLRRSGRLARLRTDSATPAVQAVFGAPYDRLDPALQRLLGLLGDQGFTANDVAALLSTRTTDAARLLEQLAAVTAAHLSAPGGPRLPGLAWNGAAGPCQAQPQPRRETDVVKSTTDAYPMTLLQAGMVFHSELEPGPAAHHSLPTLTVRGLRGRGRGDGSLTASS